MKNNKLQLSAFWKKGTTLILGLGLLSGGMSSQAATDCNAVTEISKVECESLLELYHSTNGAGWKKNEGWNVTNTPCSWYRVTCENGGVTKIYLSFNKLTGAIPDFSALPNLQELLLSSNQLPGAIPDFSALPNFKYLFLDDNQLTGAIPNFSALPNLEMLYLKDNQLTGAIPDFSALPNLQSLYLGENQLTGTIPDFSALPKLWVLYLHKNKLTGTIPNFSALPKLGRLQLYSNQLTGAIPDFSALPNLLDIKLYSNQLTGTIPDFSALPKLQKLMLFANQLTGAIPNFRLPNLEILGISLNQLTGAIPDFSAPDLRELSLSDNQLTGTIPDFSALPNLYRLYLDSNKLTGAIPNFSALPNLKRLYLYNNQLTGAIPDFSALPNLLNLKLYSNQLTGTIPDFSALTKLEYLDLRNNPICKDTNINYAILPIKQANWDDETTWQEQLNTFLNCHVNSHTLILTNHEKLAQLYSPTEADKVVSKLNELANYPDVKGLVIQVENDSTVAATYAARGNDYDNKNQANAVADAIKQLILYQWNDNLENVVIVGDDRVMPFYRIKDGTDTPDTWTLTDDFYTDRKPSNCPGCANLKREIYIPDIASGRLIESPSQIIGVVDTFLADDTLNINDAAVTGYDSFADGAQAHCNTLRVADIYSNCTLIGESWTSSNFKEQILNTYHDITSINNHAAYNLFGTPKGIVYAKDFVNTSIDFSRTLFYTMGCHSGQNVSNELDLPESLAILRANYIANTGYGWGTKIGVGLSEELMWNLTKELVKSQRTLGKALMEAKIQYFAGGHPDRLDPYHPDWKLYDEKIVAESTLYGLPMYKINSSVTPLASAIATGQTQTTQENGLQKDSYAYTWAKTTAVVTASDDSFYSLDGAITGGDGEPILPKLAQDVSNPEKALHGMVFRGGSYTIVNAAPPLQRYQTTTGYISPERTFTAPNWYPSTFFTPNTVQLDRGRKDMLVATAGQYNPNVGQQRIFDNMDFDFYYHAQANDWTEPTVYLTNSSLNANTAIVTVTTSDASAIKEVVVAYTDGKNTWNSINLTNGGETWSGNFAANANTEFFIQSVDNAGNVAINDNEGKYFKSDEPTVVEPEKCTAKGNVWVDDECKPLPITTGSLIVTKADGTLGTSKAKFSGGWSEEGSPYQGTMIYDGGEITITQVIRFDPAHVGEEVDIIILLNLYLPPPVELQLWYQVSGTSGFVMWDESLATIEAFETHTIVAGESKVIGPYNLGVLEGLPTSEAKFDFGYRTNNGTIITTGVPTTLKVR